MISINQDSSKSIIHKTIVFGASGFIGQYLIRELEPDKSLLVTRGLKKITSITLDGRHWCEADLLNPLAIERVLSSGATVINLAYSHQSSAEDNIKMAENLMQACIRANILKLVHCSTAIVCGNTPFSIIDENIECSPITPYEKTKHKIEKVFLDATDKLSIYILRPTVVVGPGGDNLKKMISDIKGGNTIMNFIRSSIYGARKLNLVPVKDVVRALVHLSERNSLSSGVYICSADDDSSNRYDCIEELMRKLLIKPWTIKPIYIPKQFLNALLYITRFGSGKFSNRTYSSEKLSLSGFQKSSSLLQAISEFVLSEK